MQNFSPSPFQFFSTAVVWSHVLEKNTICLLPSQYHRTQFTILLWSGCDKKTFIVVLYNLPALHKLNLPCFLWLTKEHKFNGAQTKASHSPCNTQFFKTPLVTWLAAIVNGRPVLSEIVRWSGFSFTTQGENSVNEAYPGKTITFPRTAREIYVLSHLIYKWVTIIKLDVKKTSTSDVQKLQKSRLRTDHQFVTPYRKSRFCSEM